MRQEQSRTQLRETPVFNGLDDLGLQVLCDELAEQVKSGARPAVLTTVDLRGATVTNEGLASLVAFATAERVKIRELSLAGAVRLASPMAVVTLLRHPVIGLPGRGLQTLRLSPKDTSCELFWRVLEVCCVLRPRPPLALVLSDQLGHLEPVVREAMRRGLKADRVTLLPGRQVPRLSASSPHDVVLFITLVLQ